MQAGMKKQAGKKKASGWSPRSAGALLLVLSLPLLASCASEALVPLPPEKPQLNVPRPGLDAAAAAEHKRLAGRPSTANTARLRCRR